MINYRLPFINHESELAFIEGLIEEWGTRRVLCIDAPSGIGKTHLLYEIRRRYTEERTHTIPIIVPEPIDFHDFGVHNLQNMCYKIAHSVSERHFEPFLRVLLNWHKMDLAGVSSEQLSQAAVAVNQTFIDCLKMVTARVVLLFDSTEILRERDVLIQMIHLSSQLENIVIIAAGRDARSIGEYLFQQPDRNVRIMVLQPLSFKSAETYTYYIQEAYNTNISADVMQRCVFLTEGQPVLIALATYVYSLGTPPNWLVELESATLFNLSVDHVLQLRQQFRQDLVSHMVGLQGFVQQLMLLLFAVYPLDVEMIGDILNLPEETARMLFEQFRHYAFMKQLPNQRFQFHDEVQKLFDEHDWAAIDHIETSLRQYWSNAITYFARKKELIARRLDHLQTTAIVEIERRELRIDSRELKHRTTFMQSSCTFFLEKTTLEHELEMLSIQQLHYALLLDLHKAVGLFTQLFDDATKKYNFRLRKSFLMMIKGYRDKLNAEDLYELDSRHVIALMDETYYLEAKDLATEILERSSISPSQRAYMLVQCGNAEMRMGFFDRGIANFELALKVSQEHHLDELFALARHARGWAHCNQGRYDLALSNYLDAFQLSLKRGDFERIAWILHDISYIHALRGNRQAAMEHCHAALDLWQEEIHNARGLGAAYTALAEVYARFHQTSEALSYYTRALDIFTKQQDIEWMSIVQSGRAFVYQAQGDLDKAELDQMWSIKHSPANLRPRILHSQFLTYLAKKDIDTARQKLEECRRVSQEFGDIFNEYKSFADLIELAWESGECDQWQAYLKEFEQLYSMKQGDDVLRLRGSCLRKIADLAICSGNYDAALAIYLQALPMIADTEVHERYTIRSQMRQTDKRLRDRIPDTMMHQLGKDLAAFWLSVPELVAKYPEVLLMFSRW